MATVIVVEELASAAVRGRGGHAAFVLQWLHGLERLGHRVVFLEFLGDDGSDPAATAREFARVVETYWRPGQSALVVERGLRSLYGLGAREIEATARDAIALICLSPTYHPEPLPLVGDVRPRIVLDTDPAYTQIWATMSGPDDIYGQQDIYFTIGRHIGTDRCAVPSLGIHWHHVWNPVLLDWWHTRQGAQKDRFSTVGDWRGYGYLEFEGRILGPKAEELRKFVDLPRRTGETFNIILTIDPNDPDVHYLTEQGWVIDKPGKVGTPGRYRAMIEQSAGEFSCAKGGYVGTDSGWFSDRTATYLAAGRPAIVQATGFETVLPTGKGLFAVETVEEAAEAVAAIRKDYSMHSAAARAIAVEHFDSDKICATVLAGAGVTSASVGV